MTPTVHHHLVATELRVLRPTQITVGLAEVARKRAEWAGLEKKARRKLLASHWFPSVLGPRGRHYIVDHHHLGLALLEEGVDEVGVLVLEDLSYLAPETFWRVMESRRWVHPFDRNGRRRGYDAIPQSVRELVDDPHRSLAGFLRAAGGYAKDASPFAEFLWADYLREHIARGQIRVEPEAALREALGLARSPLARYLPGWSGTTAPAAALVAARAS